MLSPRQLLLHEPQPARIRLVPEPDAEHGEVFTRPWVVDLILDLVDYRPEHDLAARVIVEPSCGRGAFLRPIVERLLRSAKNHGRDLASLGPAVRAFDLIESNAAASRRTVVGKLVDAGMAEDDAAALAAEWVTTADFLLLDHEVASADYVVGNPPYVRLEHVTKARMAAYRRACPTMRGRADLYVGFIERGLELLKPGGALSFICADRWMRNQYGAALREVIAEAFAVDAVISMHDVDAFEDEVSAYPAIVVLRRGRQKSAVVVDARDSFTGRDARRLVTWIRRERRRARATRSYEAIRVAGWFGRDLWPAGSPARLAVLADLEARFPPLEDPRTGTRVGIGVATGCDDVFITTDADLVEEDRLLPLLQARDTTTGVVDWSGAYLVNPWNGRGLVDLDRYPRLERYLHAHEVRLRSRHVARRRPDAWYRTIDRVDVPLTARPKLVLPDMKAAAHPVLEEGGYYPHHNLYFVVSEAWDLEVLGGLLLSDVANLFVGAYCVKMRGGTYRFQAQYLRRIRVPDPRAIGRADRKALARAFAGRDAEAATLVTARLYGIDRSSLVPPRPRWELR